jgi:pteridine reductase
MDKKIQNSPKAALITGGAIRVGKALSLAMARDGYDIALHYNNSAAAAHATAEEIRSIGVKCELIQTDLGNSQATSQLIDKAKFAFPHLCALINSASIFEKHSLANTSEDIFDRHMNINFKAPFILTQKFAEECKQGVIINILDTYITKNTGAYFAYLLSKKALYELTNMSAKNLAPNIRVNGICIGSLLASEHWSESDIIAHTNALPLQKTPTVDDITDALCYLTASDYLTGQCIFVDSGQSIS